MKIKSLVFGDFLDFSDKNSSNIVNNQQTGLVLLCKVFETSSQISRCLPVLPYQWAVRNKQNKFCGSLVFPYCKFTQFSLNGARPSSLHYCSNIPLDYCILQRAKNTKVIFVQWYRTSYVLLCNTPWTLFLEAEKKFHLLAICLLSISWKLWKQNIERCAFL